MRLTGKRALEMAGIGLDQIDFIDLYSCFPVAVEIGAEELGLALDDPRGLTVTGGLPYAGGPGNNYVMHSIAVMVQKLRAKPGRLWAGHRQRLVPDQAVDGIYSTKRPEAALRTGGPRGHPAPDRRPAAPRCHRTPQGAGRIETYTVVHRREGPFMGIVVGRDANDRRFVAVTPNDPATLAQPRGDGAGRADRPVSAGPDGQTNLFTPD